MINPPSPTDLLPLQLFLAGQLPEEIEYVNGEKGDYFYWRYPRSVSITPREWDYIVRMVEEKLIKTQSRKDQYIHEIDKLVQDRNRVDIWKWFTASWKTRASALMKIKDDSL